jgi:hypothetical protein
MSKTYKKPQSKSEDEKVIRKKRHHSNNRKTGGIKIINIFEKELDNEYKYEYEKYYT